MPFFARLDRRLFGVYLAFLMKLRCEYDLGGLTLVLWWHWEAQEGWV